MHPDGVAYPACPPSARQAGQTEGVTRKGDRSRFCPFAQNFFDRRVRRGIRIPKNYRSLCKPHFCALVPTTPMHL